MHIFTCSATTSQCVQAIQLPLLHLHHFHACVVQKPSTGGMSYASSAGNGEPSSPAPPGVGTAYATMPMHHIPAPLPYAAPPAQYAMPEIMVAGAYAAPGQHPAMQMQIHSPLYTALPPQQQVWYPPQLSGSGVAQPAVSHYPPQLANIQTHPSCSRAASSTLPAQLADESPTYMAMPPTAAPPAPEAAAQLGQVAVETPVLAMSVVAASGEAHRTSAASSAASSASSSSRGGSHRLSRGAVGRYR